MELAQDRVQRGAGILAVLNLRVLLTDTSTVRAIFGLFLYPNASVSLLRMTSLLVCSQIPAAPTG
jgi:hypothetical protein